MSDMFISGSSPVDNSGHSQSITPQPSLSVGNTTVIPVSNLAAQQPEKESETLVDHEFTGQYTEPLYFENKKFIDPYVDNPRFLNPGSELKNCLLTAKDYSLRWRHFEIGKIFWNNTIIDGLCNEKASRLDSFDLSGLRMNKGGVKNLVFSDPELQDIYDVNFTDVIMENVAFSVRYPLRYILTDVKFTGVCANKLVLENVKFAKDVVFKDIWLRNVVMLGKNEFHDSTFPGYGKGDMTLSDDNFASTQQILENLTPDCTPRLGAAMFNSLNSINNTPVRRDQKEQIAQKFTQLPLMAKALQYSRSLQQSVLLNMDEFYPHSAEIKRFNEQVLLPHFRLRGLTMNQHAAIATILNHLDPTTLPEYEFLANQLPVSRRVMNQHSARKELMDFCQQFDKAGSNDVLFYCAEQGQAIYLPAEEFEQLINQQLIPRNLQLLAYDRQNNHIKTVALSDENLSSHLQSFPGLASRWQDCGTKLRGVIHAIFSFDAGPEGENAPRAAEIRDHLIALLTRKTQKPFELTSESDFELLEEMLLPLEYKNNRRTLGALVSESLGLAQRRLSVGLEKCIASLILANMLIRLFSAPKCITTPEYQFLLCGIAGKFISDADKYSPDTLPPAWISSLGESVNRPAVTLLLMMSDDFYGENGAEMSELLRQHIPEF
ncbi:MAG: hypothetical protein PW844_28145 [Pantoea sp.]|uniref:hypothetical protein n=1 Tax=Pantoea sp. TaxID=69393 RepID=UPI0023A1E47B|nr:hypothetical protein [Pantoea sp.]MDE1190288.1 hypothetical protein [Pantoea sp.]